MTFPLALPNYPLKSLLPMLLLPLRSQRLAFRLPLPIPRQTIQLR